MPDKVVESPYPLIDADPHFSRVLRYMRPSDYAVWAGATAAFPSALYFWGNIPPPVRTYRHTNSPRLLLQRWPIPQSRVCGPLCAWAVCLVSLVASYLPTSGRVVSFLCYFLPATRETALTLCSPCLNLSPFLGLVGE